MTVREVIDKADSLYPNVFSFSEKAEWLRELDGKIYHELLVRYGDKDISEENIGALYLPDTKLLVEAPYESLYMLYISMKLDILNSDIARYENSAALFNSEYLAYSAYYNRTHTIKSVRITG